MQCGFVLWYCLARSSEVEMSWACEAWRIAYDWLLVAICTAVSIVFGYVRVGTVQWTWPKSDVLRNGVGHGTFSSTLLL